MQTIIQFQTDNFRSLRWRKFRGFWLCGLLVIFSQFAIFAERLPVKIYTSADGLGSSFVDYLLRDSRGFMWFCTRDGLSRFDGSRFVTYQIGEKNAPPGIESIYETRDGMYWISTTGGTYRFNPNDISSPDPNSPHLNAEFITGGRGAFFEDRKGNLWITSGEPAHFVQDENGQTVLQTIELNLPSNPNRLLAVNDMCETSDGSLWFDTSWGLVRRLPDNRIVFYPKEVPINTGNTAMIVDKAGLIWLNRGGQTFVLKPAPPDFYTGKEQFITQPLEANRIIEVKVEGKFVLPTNDGEIFQFTTPDVDDFVESSYAKRLFQTSDGDIWITAENYLLQFSNNIFYLHHENEGLPNIMTRMEENAAGNLWIGGHAGLARMNRQGLITFKTLDGTNSTRFFAITEGKNGELFFAGRDFFLNRFDGNKFQAVRPNIPPKSQYLWTSRFAYNARNGDWWILTSDKLYRFSGVNDFTQLSGIKPTKIYSQADGLHTNPIFQIFEDSAENIWVSTRGGGDKNRIARLNKGEERFQLITKNEGLAEGKAFSAAVEDSSGKIWFSFYEGGIARFDGTKFEVFEEKDGLPKGLLTDLHIDKKGRLWIGSSLGGLIRVDNLAAPIPSFTFLTTANGLTSNNIRTITEDDFGRIYIGTARGVDQLSPENGHVKHFSVNDGLASDFVVDSHRDQKGNLWFATNNGISRLTPLPEKITNAPRVLFGGLRIDGVEQPISQFGNSNIDKGELSYTQNNLQIDFFGLDFRAGEMLQYQYQLEGADTDWSAPTELRTVTFANLQPAEYRFLVRAINSEGVFSENPAVISFKILSPIWLRWWFIALGGLALTLIAFSFYRYRLARLKEVNKALEEARFAEENLRKSREERLAELEKVRSRIATDLHDDIGASLTQIAILSEVAQAQSKGNGASEPLSKITNVSNELVGTMSDIVWAINPAKDHLSDLIQRMRRFASDSLSAKGMIVQFSSPKSNDKIVVNTNLRREVFLIFKESISNIVKHSEAQKVKIVVEVTDQDLQLKITDDGKGFATEKTYENSLSSIEMGGVGILSMEKRAQEMDGKFEISSQIGNGTEVFLKLPMDAKSNLSPTAQTGGDISANGA